MEVLVRDAHEGAEEPGAPGDLPDPAEDDLEQFLLGDTEAAILVLADVVVVLLPEAASPGASLHVAATFPAREEIGKAPGRARAEISVGAVSLTLQQVGPQ